MSQYIDKVKIDGKTTSLKDNPCISVCSLTYGAGDKCICGRSFSQVSNWNGYDDVTKKIIVMNAIEDKESLPRQKLTFLADEYDISMDSAKQIFVTDRKET